MANRELAQKILDQVENKPHTHNQRFWFRKDRTGEDSYTLMPYDSVECGTTLCVAGWAAHMNGYLLTHYQGGVTIASLPLGPQRQVPDVGRELLGLSEMDAYILFHHTYVTEAVAALEQIAAGRDYIEWLDVFGDDEEGNDHLEGIMDDYYRDLPDYSYDYEN